MNFEVKIETRKEISTVAYLTKEYFKNQGFDISEEQKNSITFKRGSKFLNSITFNPLKWKSQITVLYETTQIIARFDIDTENQLVTVKEEQLWITFIENFKKTIESGNTFITENNKNVSSTIKHSWKLVLKIFGITAIIVFLIILFMVIAKNLT